MQLGACNFSGGISGRVVRDVVAGIVCAMVVWAAVPGPAIGAVVSVPLLLAAVPVVAVLVTRAARGSRTGWLERPVRVAVITAACLMAAAGASFAEALEPPSSSSLPIRAVEWLRDNGAAGLVSAAERLYYTLTAPAPGGPALTRLPQTGVAAPPRARRRAVAARRAVIGYVPRRLRPVVRPALAGEGVWRPTQRRFARDPSPPVLVTAFRPDPRYPRIVAGLAWINRRRTTVSLYPGLAEPPAGAPNGPGEVLPSRRRALLATFNGGFKYRDGHGGFVTGGRQLEPLLPGRGTVFETGAGNLDVRAWHGAGRVVFARQNLPLIVDQGRPNPNLSDGPQWGATLGNRILVWRSGVGIDRHGDLIYAAAPYQSVAGLARILIHAGAVRAIELDINSYWVTLNTYGLPGARAARPLLPLMNRSPERYLVPDDRDFFAVYLR